MRFSLRLLFKLVVLIALVAAAELLPELGAPWPTEWFLVLRPLLRVAAFGFALHIGLWLFKAAYRRRKGLPRGYHDATLFGLTNIYYIVLAFLAMGGIIRLYGLDLRTLFTSLSIIAAAIAIVTRDFIVEVIAGLIMSFSGHLAVGDYISLGTTKGRVATLTLTKVVLTNEDEDLVHLPNSKVFGGELVNYTQRMQRRVSIEFEVVLTAIESVDDFERRLVEALASFGDAIVAGSCSLRVVQLHKDFAELKFRYTLHERSLELERDIRRRTSRTVINYIHSAGVRGRGGR